MHFDHPPPHVLNLFCQRKKANKKKVHCKKNLETTKTQYVIDDYLKLKLQLRSILCALNREKKT